MRRKDLNALERTQREEVRVASDQVCCSATYCKFEKLVIFWIAASPYFGLHIHPLSLARDGCEKGSNIFFIHIAAETLSAYDFIDFVEHCDGNQYFSSSNSNFNSLPSF